MARKEKTTADFHFTFGTLKQLADSTLLLIDRDIQEFTDYGFTAERRTEFETVIREFESLPTDEQLISWQMKSTSTKDILRATLTKQMRTFFLMAKNVFGESSATYREFGNGEISRQTDDELVRTGRIMKAACSKYLRELTKEGMTKGKINTFAENLKSFDDSIDVKTQAVNNRDIGTEDRIILANKLYALIIKYSDIGKDIWIEQSESRYNDYVIYNTPSGTPETSPEQPDGSI